jgi:hypothetical protein
LTVRDRRKRPPIPRQQFIQPVDLVIVNAIQDICKTSLRTKIIKPGRFDDRHGSRKGFHACIGSCKQLSFPPYANGARGPLGGIVVNGRNGRQSERRFGLFEQVPGVS